ncbi:MAG TPA: lycopene cyclase domain-containing protein [Lacisediminihabitans sp.]|uniref:lycopene cyclase domain-containing protein n=1 Tax=Lacisediminihabitans sp. TaxID=2787631 RepID=UPI002ED9EB54
MTYLWLSAAFLAVAALVLLIAVVASPGRRILFARWWMPILTAGATLAALTAVFDNVMIRVGLMTYARDAISGLRIGLAPLEDFAYPLAGLLLLPAVWFLLGRRGPSDR